jgi:NADH-quinone oxidoreductase subunit E
LSTDLSKINNILAEYSNLKGALIPVLQHAQDAYGYLPKEVMEKIAENNKISVAEVYGVATFYTQFRLKPMGKYIIKICHGTACHVGGANVLDEMIRAKLNISFGETTPDGMFTVMSVACLGCCSLAPAVMIGDNVYGKLDNDKFSKVIDQYLNTENKAKT